VAYMIVLLLKVMTLEVSLILERFRGLSWSKRKKPITQSKKDPKKYFKILVNLYEEKRKCT
jgi:hypothetical protein